MADFERRNNYRGGPQNRKRRHREDDDFDRRPPRRRYDEPAHIKLRKQLLAIAESPHKTSDDEISAVAKLVLDGYEDEDLKAVFLDLSLQLVLEQPMKIPFVAAVIIYIDTRKPELTKAFLARVSVITQTQLNGGAWREVKLLLRLLACLQGIFKGEGIFPVLDELFSRAVDLQTASSEDGLGLELVKIILLTIAYAMASSATNVDDRVMDLLEKTEIIASAPHAFESLVDPYPGSEESKSHTPQSLIGLLQRQLQAEAAEGWKLECLPRLWNIAENIADYHPEHAFPEFDIPSPVSSGKRPRLPEVYFSVYANQDIETVPPETNIASILIRDAVIDTINILDYNRNATAKFLIELDCYFAPSLFVKRATPFDKLKDLDPSRSTWKPEDVAVDAVFSQLFHLPVPEHKLVYYHAVLTEACKLAPAAIAPSLGRAIRCLYRNVDAMDLELEYRFMDWFSHHLSNFGFTWKWTEWVDDVDLPMVHAKKAFIAGALEKEIRLSFAQRIRGTLPEPYHALISEAKEKDVPDFKYNFDETPFAPEARELLRLLRTRAPDSDLQPPIDAIHTAVLAADPNTDALVASTDALVTCICFLGAKSLSHVLSYIERYKIRLLAIGPASETARCQILASVLAYWAERPGVGATVADKLLNYTILAPRTITAWLAMPATATAERLTHAHVFEMLAGTTRKVAVRVREIVVARQQRGLTDEQRALLDETLALERAEVASLFADLGDLLRLVAEGRTNDADNGSGAADAESAALLRGWGRRWAKVFERKRVVEEAWVEETLAGGLIGDEEEKLAGVEREERHDNRNGTGPEAMDAAMLDEIS